MVAKRTWGQQLILIGACVSIMGKYAAEHVRQKDGPGNADFWLADSPMSGRLSASNGGGSTWLVRLQVILLWRDGHTLCRCCWTTFRLRKCWKVAKAFVRLTQELVRAVVAQNSLGARMSIFLDCCTLVTDRWTTANFVCHPGYRGFIEVYSYPCKWKGATYVFFHCKHVYLGWRICHVGRVIIFTHRTFALLDL